jgi:hypothetical protein
MGHDRVGLERLVGQKGDLVARERGQGAAFAGRAEEGPAGLQAGDMIADRAHCRLRVATPDTQPR